MLRCHEERRRTDSDRVESPLRIRHAPDSSGWGHQAHVAVSVSSARLGLTNPNRPRGLAPFPTEGGVDSSNRPGSDGATPHPPHTRHATPFGRRPRGVSTPPPHPSREPRGHAVLSVSTPRRSTRGGDAHLTRVGEPRHLEVACDATSFGGCHRPPSSAASHGAGRPASPHRRHLVCCGRGFLRRGTPAACRARSRPYVRGAPRG